MAKRNEEESSNQPVLITRFSALGDVALALPVVYDVCRSNSERKFVFLTRQRPAQMFINAPENLEVIGIDTDAYAGFVGLNRLAKEIFEQYHPSTFIDLHDVLRTSLLQIFMALKGVRIYSIDKGRREKRALTRSDNKAVVQLRRTIDRYRDVFVEANIQSQPRFISVYQDTPPEARTVGIEEYLPEPGVTAIAIAPFARHKGKIYPRELMECVVREFASREDMRIYLFGAPGQENETLKAWETEYPRCVNMAEKGLSMQQEIALMSMCSLMISMDSANMHLASLAGVRVLSIWGATHPYCGFLGVGQRTEDCIQLEMTCRPCSVYGNKECYRGDLHCLRGIRPDHIISRAEAILEEIKKEKG